MRNNMKKELWVEKIIPPEIDVPNTTITLNEKKYRHLNRLDKPPKERVFGRYNASEIGSIIKRYQSAKSHFKQSTIENNSFFPNMVDTVLLGMFIEDGYNKMFDGECSCGDKQNKYEYKLNDEITVVVKPDFEWEDRIWEMKCPVKPLEPGTIPDKWKYQLEMEHRVTNKDVYLFVVMVGDGKLIETLTPYTPSDETFEEIKSELIRYHSLIKKYKLKEELNK